MTTPSIRVGDAPAVQYVLRLGDTCLILAQRLGEWCGHGPVLEEDLALTNMALDLIGQARALLTHAAHLDGQGHDEDQLAFLRDERQYVNVVLAELPNGEIAQVSAPGDFAFTVLRNLALATWLHLLWQRLLHSRDAELAAIAAKAVKEAQYHAQHAADWTLRLGDGTAESHARMQAALTRLWPYTNELFASDAVDAAAEQSGLGPRWSALQGDWQQAMTRVLNEATLTVPAASRLVHEGHRGVHSEHMGPLLAVMQHLQRCHPGGVW